MRKVRHPRHKDGGAGIPIRTGGSRQANLVVDHRIVGIHNVILTRMSRRGNRNLKRAYFQIVAPMVWFDHGDNFYKNLYKRKMAEGRAWYTAMPFACAALARHIYHCLKFQEPYQLEKAFGRVLTSHVDDLVKSKFQADLEGTFEVMDAHLPQEVELQPPLRK